MRQFFDTFLAWYFDLSITDESSSLHRDWRIEASWNWQTFPILLMILGIVGLAFWLAKVSSERRSFRFFVVLFVTRLAVLFVAALLVFQVQFKTISFGRPSLILLVDTSGSMSLSDRYTSSELKKLKRIGISKPAATRIELLKKVFTNSESDWFSDLEQRFDIQLLAFDAKLHDVSQTATQLETTSTTRASSEFDFIINQIQQFRANGLSTDFKTTLEQLARTKKNPPPTAVVLFSDGFATVHSPAALDRVTKNYQRLRIPIHSVGIGSPAAARDLVIEEVDSEPVGFTGDNHPLTVSVSANEQIAGPIQLIVRDLSSGEKVAEERLKRIVRDQIVEVMIVIPKLESGRNDFGVELVSPVGENDLKNNTKKIGIWGRDAKLNVLLIEQFPSWEFRHLKTSLERDPHLYLKTFLFEGDPAYAIEDQTALSRLPETLENFDALILGNLHFNLLPANFPALVETFIKQDGGLLLLSGNRSFEKLDLTSVMAELHPSIGRPNDGDERMQVNVSVAPEGQAQRIFPIATAIQDSLQLPANYPISQELAVKPSALTLLEGQPIDLLSRPMPLVLSMRYGSGFVIQHLMDDTWRWKAIDGGDFFRKFWSQTIRNLCRRKLIEQLPPLEFFTNQDRYRSRESAQVVLVDRKKRFVDKDTVTAFWKQEDQRGGEVLLRRTSTGSTTFSGTIPEIQKGAYVVTIPATDAQASLVTTTFQVVESNAEKEYHPLEETTLRRLAERTDGHFFYPWELDDFAQHLPQLKYARDSKTLIIPLWNRWEILLSLMGLFTLEWVLRRRAGLD